MKMHMLVQARAKPVDESHRADLLSSLVHLGHTRAMSLQALRNNAQEDTQHHVEHCPVALHEVAQALGHRQHPLAHRQTGENMIRQVRRRLHHAAGIARGADTPAFAGEGDKVVVRAVAAAGACKAVGKDAALQVFAKRLAHKGLWRVAVALAVELTCTGELMPGLEVFGNGLVQQRALRVTRVVEFGFGRRAVSSCGRCALARMVVRMGPAG